MILGMGVDIVEVERIEEAFRRWKRRFSTRVFTAEEIRYCASKPNMYHHFAARFAAKEAVLKAFGMGWTAGIKWTDIEIVPSRLGRPRVRFHNRAGEVAERIGLKKVTISLSHCKLYAVASAIIE
ncbi:MAG: holo-ACP synthase [bacterium]